jgi:regulatory subunit for Cdc7p protein kinase
MHRVRASQQTLALAHATSVKTNRKVQEPSQEVVQESRRRQTENEIWRQKYKRAFPNFIFHFDSVDAASAKRYGEFILELGGHVDQFFSRRVTHVITTRQVPEEGAPGEPASLEVAPREPAPREPITSAGGCNAERLSAQKLFRPSFLASRAASTKAGGNSSRRPVPLFSERNPLQEPPRGQYGPQDMLVKAQSFGMRIWQLEKLQNVVVRLLNLSMRDLEGPRKKDLSKMLQMEKVYGTTERDPSAARSSFHYFDKHSKYILVEDATMEHRPIISHEYTYTDDEKAEEAKPPWPVVYGETLGRCPFTFYAPKRNAVKPRDGEDVSPLRLEVPQSLRRAVSLNNMARSNLGPAERPQAAQLGAIEMKRQQNPLASGNSVSITSNIASTTSNIFTDQQTGATVGLPQNRRVAELNRRVHMSNVYSRPLHLLNASPASVMAGSTTASGLGLHREGGSGAIGSPAAQRGAESGATVRRMLGLEDQRAPGMALQRSASTSAVDRPPSAKKPGYCENCRVKYEDFTEHIYDRKHRKFATNEVHFVDIDALIMRVQRPIRPSSEDELSSGFLEFEAIPSSQPEENVAYSDSDEELSAGSPEAEDDEAGEGEEMPASMRTHVHGAYA